MKLVLFAALALIVVIDAARSEEGKCLFDRTKPTAEVTCLHVELPAVVPSKTVTTTTANAAAVAAMPPLLQPDTMVKQVAEQ